MAGSEPRRGGASPQPHHSDWGRLEAALLSGWRSFWQSVGKERTAPSAPQGEAAAEADAETSALTRLPVSGGCRPRGTEGPGRAWGGSLSGGPPSAPVWVWPLPCSPSGRWRPLGATVDQKRPGVESWAPRRGRRSPRSSPSGGSLVRSAQVSAPKQVWGEGTLNARRRRYGDRSRLSS